jgi:Putative Flp pilus-assembly TadE/G-like
MAALFFLAFAYFAVGQATVLRNGTQTAADAAALAAAREYRDEVHDTFLQALLSGNLTALGKLLTNLGADDGQACAAAQTYAAENKADVESGGCNRVSGPPGYTVDVVSRDTVGRSVVDGTENTRAHASATAVVEPRCTADSKEDGHKVSFACPGGDLVVDPTASDFTLDLGDFYSVHLSN